MITLTKEQKLSLLKNTSGYDLAKIFETTNIDYLSNQQMILKPGFPDWKDLYVNGELATSFQTSFLKELEIIK